MGSMVLSHDVVELHGKLTAECSLILLLGGWGAVGSNRARNEDQLYAIQNLAATIAGIAAK